MLKEFKEFALKGNVIDLAIGVVVGSAFQAIVNSLVNDIIMPLLSLFTGDMDFSDWVLKIGTTTIPYGSFISAIVSFLIIAFSLFLAIKYINKINKKLEDAKLQEAKRIAEFKTKSKLLNKLEKISKKDTNENNVSSEDKKEENIVSTTKLCPFCFSEINVNAVRCPHCTSHLEN